MDGLILRFDAPLMSFGGVMVDQHGVTDRFPGLSLFAGMVANSLGWNHKDAERIDAFQARITVASRWDIEPRRVLDYQTVDLGQPKMRGKGWTTKGVPEHREGGSAAKYGTHQRYRHYLANGVLTSVFTLTTDENPDLDAVEKSLKRPERPLFLGRKTCLPSCAILIGRIVGENVLDMLKKVPRATRPGREVENKMPARWPAGLTDERPDQLRTVYDQREWRNQYHAGGRLVAEGLIEEVTSCS